MSFKDHSWFLNALISWVNVTLFSALIGSCLFIFTFDQVNKAYGNSESVSLKKVNKRWVWIRGLHEGEACQEARGLLEGALTQRLYEFASVAPVYDGQTFNCRTDECARARLITIGGVVGLYSQSECVGQHLTYQVRILSRDSERPPLVYQASFKVQKDLQAQTQGYALAKKILKGPRRPRAKKQQRSLWSWGGQVGGMWSTLSENNVMGTQFKVTGAYELPKYPHLELQIGLGAGFLSEETLDTQDLRAELGIRWKPAHPHLGLWLAAGVTGLHYWSAQLQKRPSSLDLQENFWFRDQTLQDRQRADFLPWLESGWVFRSAQRFHPLITLRYTSWSLFDDLGRSEVACLFGMRWR